jgi:LacI family transcriptional regulator
VPSRGVRNAEEPAVIKRIAMKRITINDLARMLNLSKSTVSRALSDHPDISEETKKRVQQVASEFSFTANLHAAFFRQNRSGLVALVLPEFNMFFTPGLIDGINKVIADSKKSLIVFLSNNSLTKEQDIIRQCLNWAVEGILISLSKETQNLEHLSPVFKSEIACVQIDKTLVNDCYPAVTIDNVAASYNAVSYLLQKGHRNILGIFGNPNYSISKDRKQGYIKAMNEYNITFPEENLITVDNSSELDYILPPILKHNLSASQSGKTFTAIFAMSDELLARSNYLINSIGIKIPEQLSVIAISDGVYPHLTYPKVTHVKDAGVKMGETACHLLLDIISGTYKKSDGHVYVDTMLVELDSVAPYFD